jgi:hypothetical protein
MIHRANLFKTKEGLKMSDKKAYEVRYGRSDVTYTVCAKNKDEAEEIASKMLAKDFGKYSDFYFIESEEANWAKEWDCENYEESEEENELN